MAEPNGKNDVCKESREELNGGRNHLSRRSCGGRNGHFIVSWAALNGGSHESNYRC
jgi:hypothetical protein